MLDTLGEGMAYIGQSYQCLYARLQFIKELFSARSGNLIPTVFSKGGEQRSLIKKALGRSVFMI